MFKIYIYYFIEVVKSGSFSKASKKFYISQSAVSQQISNLEKELGFSLFERNTYRPTLTKKGKEYYDLCLTLMDTYNKGINKIKDSNTINIGITGPFEKKHIPVLIKEFKKTHKVKFNVIVNNFRGGIDDLLTKKVDISFGLINDFNRHLELNTYKIYESHICAVLSRDHPLSNRNVIDIKEIKDEEIVILSKDIGTYYYDDFMEAFKLDGIKPKITKEVKDLDEYLLAISLNEGVGLSAVEVIDDDNVKTVLLKNTNHHADYAFATLKNNDKDIDEFVQAIIKYFKELTS